MAATVQSAVPRAARPLVPARRSRRGRLIAILLRAMSALLTRLPDRALHRLAHALGGLLYRAQPARRALVRSNLRRVCRYLAATGLAAPPTVLAASDEAALERLVREAFGHYVRGYLEGAIVSAYAGARGRGRAKVTADDPDLAEEILGPAGGPGRAVIVIGMHFGAVEIPGLYAADRGVVMTSPMETVADPDVQAYLLRSRSSTGLRIIPTLGAGRELARCLAAGRPVAIVADRAVSGVGTRVTLFGAPARLPVGPAVLALQSGAPVFVVAARRTGWGDYRARIERLEVPASGTRRQRMAGFMEAQARLFERVVADAPEQWWTLFFPIWDAVDGEERS
jgi:phosphatidylinositol dimannoside acyltransferase